MNAADCINIVTPSFNAASTIGETIASVARQFCRFPIRFHVADGGSTDNTLDVITQWGKRLSGRSEIEFTYHSESDFGMYDAITRGAEFLQPHPDAWFAWVNADDVLTSNALASLLDCDDICSQSGFHLEWLIGQRAVAEEKIDDFHAADQYFSKSLIVNGCMDGSVCPFLQQEGTFFRAGLLDAETRVRLKSFKLAGDFYLWTELAKTVEPVYVNRPLGVFRVRKGQLSEIRRDEYIAEARNSVEHESSEKRLARAMACEQKRYFIDRDKSLLTFSDLPFKKQRDIEQRTFGSGLRAEGTVTVLDSDWQYPAITELHAYRNVRDKMRGLASGFHYLAFPWATLIDCYNNQKWPKVEYLKRKLEEAIALVPPGAYVATVCQHIDMERFEWLFKSARVRHIFWTHDRKGSWADSLPFEVSPFPLYPTNYLPPALRPHEDKYVYCFVGARSNQWYLNQTRNWILDALADDQRAFVRGRDEWHYNPIVYSVQIAGQQESSVTTNASNEEEFVNILSGSTFALCPSGSGPNSIRLWESIRAGSIPVILADTWACPGTPELWEAACLFVEEERSSVEGLRELLWRLSRDEKRVDAMRCALSELRKRYFDISFIYDMELLALRVSADYLARGVYGYSLEGGDHAAVTVAEYIVENRSDSREVLREALRTLVESRAQRCGLSAEVVAVSIDEVVHECLF